MIAHSETDASMFFGLELDQAVYARLREVDFAFCCSDSEATMLSSAKRQLMCRTRL